MRQRAGQVLAVPRLAVRQSEQVGARRSEGDCENAWDEFHQVRRMLRYDEIRRSDQNRSGSRRETRGRWNPGVLHQRPPANRRAAPSEVRGPDRRRAGKRRQHQAGVGRVAKEELALREQIAKDRAQRHADYLKWVKSPTEPPVAARVPGVQTFRAVAPAAAQRPLRILAEGDSWFDYPWPLVVHDGIIY